MFPSGWSIWCLLLTAHLSACSLDIVEHDGQVICSQGLLECTMNNGTTFDSNTVSVINLIPQVKLCCSREACALCLLVQVEVNLYKLGNEDSSSGQWGDDSTEETKDDEAETGSVAVCYNILGTTLPTCKKAEFTANLSQQSTAQISMTITNAVISYGNLVLVHSPNVPELDKEVTVPSLAKVCSSDIARFVQQCNVVNPKFMINKELNQVELNFSGSNTNPPNVCIQYETDGNCKTWDGKPIPLYLVTPCTCFQVWKEDGEASVRYRHCPFKNNKDLQINVWRNLTVSVDTGLNGDIPMLWWNLSAPCRLEGEVWDCGRTPGLSDCRKSKGFKQPLENDSWRQNSTGLWEKTGVFKQVNPDSFSCVMVKVKGMGYEMDPVCNKNIDRWRWILFAVAVMLLLCLTLLITPCLRDVVKKSMGSCHHVVKKGHVLVLSPPDSDGEVSSAVCSLGSLLCSSGFSVTVDQWSRGGQLTSGPLPWSHFQLLSMNSQCDRVVLVLSPKAAEIAEKWSGQQDSSVSNLHEESSPYSDVFRASLFAIKAYKNQGRASERFVLVTFDSQRTEAKICEKELPEILRGLPLFHYPSQTKALLSELCVGATQRQRSRTRWTWASSGGKFKDRTSSLLSKTCELETKPLQQQC